MSRPSDPRRALVLTLALAACAASLVVGCNAEPVGPAIAPQGAMDSGKAEPGAMEPGKAEPGKMVPAGGK